MSKSSKREATQGNLDLALAAIAGAAVGKILSARASGLFLPSVFDCFLLAIASLTIVLGKAKLKHAESSLAAVAEVPKFEALLEPGLETARAQNQCPHDPRSCH